MRRQGSSVYTPPQAADGGWTHHADVGFERDELLAIGTEEQRIYADLGPLDDDPRIGPAQTDETRALAGLSDSCPRATLRAAASSLPKFRLLAEHIAARSMIGHLRLTRSGANEIVTRSCDKQRANPRRERHRQGNCWRARSTTGPVTGFSKEAPELMMAAPWPGNVRQLRNVVEQCVVLATTPLIPANLVERALLLRKHELEPELFREGNGSAEN